jgi:hypothetical protein
MRRSFLLFSITAGILFLSLSSYQSGPAAGGQGNRTTSGTNATCGGGCHGANNSNTAITLTLKDGATTVSNGKYKANTLYTVTIAAANSTAPVPAKFGFQLTAVNATGGQAGNLTASGALHTSTSGTGGLTVVEQSSAITATAGVATMPSFSWLSPAAGTDSVAFHVIVNAVNGNNLSDAGDHASTAKFSFTRETLSLDEFFDAIEVAAFPNPVRGELNVRLGANAKGALVSLVSVNGAIVLKQQFTGAKNGQVVIDMAEYPSGLYFVKIAEGGTIRMLPIVKE